MWTFTFLVAAAAAIYLIIKHRKAGARGSTQFRDSKQTDKRSER